MIWFNNLKLASKLLVAVILLCLNAGAMGTVALRHMEQLRLAGHEVTGSWLPGIRHISDANSNISDFHIAGQQFVFSTDTARMTGLEQRLRAEQEKVERNLELYEPTILLDEDRRLFEDIRARWKDYLAEHEKILALARQKDSREALLAARDRTQQGFDDLSVKLDELVAFNARFAKEATARSEAAYEAMQRSILAMCVLASLFFVVIGFVLFRSLARPLNEAVAVADRIAEGNLTVRIDVRREDEVGVLLTSMQRMARKLAQVIGEVREGANALAAASSQVSASSQNLAQGNSEQASSVEETTTSLEQMTASIAQNRDHGRQMEQMAVQGARDAEEGGRAVRETVAAMGSIAEKISIIEEIADQTNLLALNAAMQHVDQVTQRNASASEELASTAEEMSTQAEALSQLVSFFHLQESSERAWRPMSQPPPTGHSAEQAPSAAHGLKAAASGLGSGAPAPRVPVSAALPDEDREFKRF